MKRLKVVVFAVLGVVALASLTAATAFGAVEILNKEGKVTTKAVKFEGTNAKTTTLSILEGFGSVTCTENKATGELEAGKPAGSYHIEFKKCTGGGGACTGLGEASGVILVLGTFQEVFDVLTTLGLATLFKIGSTVHFTCATIIGEKLVLVKGEVLCLLTPINALAKNFTVKCEGTSGDPKEVVYWNEKGEEKNIKEGLLSSENEGTSFKMSAQNGESSFETAEELNAMG